MQATTFHMVNRSFELDRTSWPDTEVEVEFVPHGVIAHIGIWNYPFWQTMITAIPALMTGNAIVFKPSEHTSLTGLRISEVLHRAGIPTDVFIPLIGGKEVGKEMVRSNFDALVFTGGQSTGLEIMHRSNVKPLILELSGNDPAIVCERRGHPTDREGNSVWQPVPRRSGLHTGEAGVRGPVASGRAGGRAYWTSCRVWMSNRASAL